MASDDGYAQIELTKLLVSLASGQVRGHIQREIGSCQDVRW
jgi:hypothetical protein